MSGKHGSRLQMIERLLKAVKFMESHNSWTIQDLSDELGINKKNGAQWLTALSVHYPIIELRPMRYGPGGGLMPGLYGLNKKQNSIEDLAR